MSACQHLWTSDGLLKQLDLMLLSLRAAGLKFDLYHMEQIKQVPVRLLRFRIIWSYVVVLVSSWLRSKELLVGPWTCQSVWVWTLTAALLTLKFSPSMHTFLHSPPVPGDHSPEPTSILNRTCWVRVQVDFHHKERWFSSNLKRRTITYIK